MLEVLKNYWPEVATVAGNFAFPFVSEIRKDAIHFDDEYKTNANILAGLGTSLIVTFLIFDRHEIYYITSKFPSWPWLIAIGILLLTLHCSLVMWARDREHPTNNSIRGIGLLVYICSFITLSLGFNLPLVENTIFVKVSGKIQCENEKEAYLYKEENVIAISPATERERRYQFLLKSGEKALGLKISAGKSATAEREVVDVTQPSDPQLGLDLPCHPNGAGRA